MDKQTLIIVVIVIVVIFFLINRKNEEEYYQQLSDERCQNLKSIGMCENGSNLMESMCPGICAVVETTSPSFDLQDFSGN